MALSQNDVLSGEVSHDIFFSFQWAIRNYFCIGTFGNPMFLKMSLCVGAWRGSQRGLTIVRGFHHNFSQFEDLMLLMNFYQIKKTPFKYLGKMILCFLDDLFLHLVRNFL